MKRIAPTLRYCANQGAFWMIALLYGLLVAFLQVNTPLTYSLGMLIFGTSVAAIGTLIINLAGEKGKCQGMETA